MVRIKIFILPFANDHDTAIIDSSYFSSIIVVSSRQKILTTMTQLPAAFFPLCIFERVQSRRRLQDSLTTTDWMSLTHFDALLNLDVGESGGWFGSGCVSKLHWLGSNLVLLGLVNGGVDCCCRWTGQHE